MPLETLELFAGAGGLALGFTEHDVEHRAVVEWNAHACQTLRLNKRAKDSPISHWPDVIEGDVRNIDYSSFLGTDLITGGPPCQPFSMGGKHGAFLDARDMFPEAIRAVRETRPQAFVFENVKGLTRSTFTSYFTYIQLQLEFPSLVAKKNEKWLDHLARLERFKTKGGASEYHLVVRLVNAADYGVPQKRMRVFFVGIRADVHKSWTFPNPTHSLEALLWSQWKTGDYWEEHRVPKKDRPEKPANIENKLEALEGGPQLILHRWLTVRDALKGLPDPEKLSPRSKFQAHKFQPGARSYPGHTGSPLDEPAKALKAGNHGVPGGENMLRRPDGSVRYFTVRESARIQTFPDEFIFEGSWTEVMRQLGNAVPVKLASIVAGSVCGTLRKG